MSAHKARPDLVVVNPGNRRRTYQSLGQDLAAIEPPVWAGLLATYVKTAGYGVELIDANALGLSPDQVAEQIQALDPVLVAVVVYGHQPSASTQNMPAASAVCDAIASLSPQQQVIMVGGHVTALPERTLQEESVRFVCTSEGPTTLVPLVETLRSGSPDFERIAGLAWQDADGHVRVNEPAPLVQDLDRQMAGLPWDMLPMERYRAHNWHCFGGLDRQPYAALYTSLGCPFRCSFCCIQAPFRRGESLLGLAPSANSYRRWSPRATLDQIGTLVEQYGVRNVKIADEMFVLHPRHVLDICDGIIERGYDVNIWAYARVDTVKDRFIDKMARAGVRWLAFGIEAASPDVRDDVSKGYDQADIERAISAVRGAGIHVIGNYIFGLPEDDRTSMQATLDLALALRCEFANFYCAMAYPGSPLYDQAIGEGWALPRSWDGYSQHAVDSLPLPTRHLSAGEVLRFRDDAFDAYFSDSDYLQHVESVFGSSTVEAIVAMSAHRLERRFATARA